MIKRILPRLELRDLVKDIWVFESSGGLSDKELQVIAPNGSAKLVLPYKGKLTCRIADQSFPIPEHKLFASGVTEHAMIADFDRKKPFGCICVEFRPAYAYRFLRVPQHELLNSFVPYEELANASIHHVEDEMFAASDPTHKANLLQTYLIKMLALTEPDRAFEFGISAIGFISIAELSQYMGLSDRWLRIKFAERLGISPRVFASIIRFQACFQTFLRDKRRFMENRQFQDFYYDQAHFIKVFKRFVGHSPAKYSALQNKVGELMYFYNLLYRRSSLYLKYG